jgi:hypothetical protein
MPQGVKEDYTSDRDWFGNMFRCQTEAIGGGSVASLVKSPALSAKMIRPIERYIKPACPYPKLS